MPSETHEHYKAHGYCTRCHKQAAILRLAVCYDCLDTMAEGKRQAREQGLCIDCWKQPVADQRTRCEPCLQRIRARRKQRYDARDAAGLCVTCGKAPQWQGRVTCAYCWGKQKGFD